MSGGGGRISREIIPAGNCIDDAYLANEIALEVPPKRRFISQTDRHGVHYQIARSLVVQAISIFEPKR